MRPIIARPIDIDEAQSKLTPILEEHGGGAVIEAMIRRYQRASDACTDEGNIELATLWMKVADQLRTALDAYHGN